MEKIAKWRSMSCLWKAFPFGGATDQAFAISAYVCEYSGQPKALGTTAAGIWQYASHYSRTITTTINLGTYGGTMSPGSRRMDDDMADSLIPTILYHSTMDVYRCGTSMYIAATTARSMWTRTWGDWRGDGAHSSVCRAEDSHAWSVHLP